MLMSILRNIVITSGLVFLLASCNGQERGSDPRQNAPVIDTTSTEGRWGFPNHKGMIDNLFFIPGQLCQHIRCMYKDSRGDFWFGTNVYGLIRYSGDTLTYYGKSDGIGSGRINAVVEDAKGILWIAGHDGLVRYDGHSFELMPVDSGQGEHSLWNLSYTRDSILWIGTMNGVSRFDGQTIQSFPVPKAEVDNPSVYFGENRIQCFMEDKDGTLWFGTDGYGITLYDGKNFSFLTMEDGLPDNNVTDLLEDDQGNVWISTMYGGISRYDGQHFTNFTQDSVIRGVEVGALMKDRDGNIWFAAENYGVYRYDGENFKNWYHDAELPTNGILCILQDETGEMWFGGWGGLFRFDGRVFYPVTRDGPWHEERERWGGSSDDVVKTRRYE